MLDIMSSAKGDWVYFEGLMVDALIGVYDHEKIKKQPLIFDLAMKFDIEKAGNSDNLTDALDYAAVAEALTGFVISTQFELLESLAEACIVVLFDAFPVDLIKFKVAKPNAIESARAAGLMITRSRLR